MNIIYCMKLKIHGFMNDTHVIIQFIQQEIKTITVFKPSYYFIYDFDEIPKKELYIDIKDDSNLLHVGEHVEMLLLNHGFKWKNKNNIWRHPLFITDRECENYHSVMSD